MEKSAATRGPWRVNKYPVLDRLVDYSLCKRGNQSPSALSTKSKKMCLTDQLLPLVLRRCKFRWQDPWCKLQEPGYRPTTKVAWFHSPVIRSKVVRGLVHGLFELSSSDILICVRFSTSLTFDQKFYLLADLFLVNLNKSPENWFEIEFCAILSFFSLLFN